MNTEFFYFLFTFIFFSVLGWVLEVVYRSFCAKRFVKPGLLRGPYLVLYGGAVLLLIKAVVFLHGYNLAVKFVVYLIITTGFEVMSGVVALRLFNAKLWDYSDERFNYKGLACVKFSVYWVGLAFVFEYLVFPAYQYFYSWLPSGVKEVFVIIFTVLMLFDLLLTLLKRIFVFSKIEMEALKAEYSDVAQPLLDEPMVQKLAQYKHHREKTRLEHVNEVAYLSFLIGKRLSLDCDAIIKGALLHDLFHYDWLREGPRFHGFRHHNIALKNARSMTSLSKKEEDIIKKHMWPLTIVPPRYFESLVVSSVDKFCSTRDYLGIFKMHVKREG